MDNNELKLNFNGLSKVSFSVEEFSITDEQDYTPMDGNPALPKVTVTDKGKGLFILTIEADRKGSKKVANQFKNWVGDENHCIAKTKDDELPGSLNFAMKGTLTLTGSDVSYPFKDVVIAQGHSGVNNNWWIGGEGGQKILNGDTLVFGASQLDVPRVNLLAFCVESHEEFTTAYYLQG